MEMTTKLQATERWRRVPGFPAYEISTKGRVRSYWKRQKGHGRTRVIGSKPQQYLATFPTVDTNGKHRKYRTLVLCNNKEHHGFRLHQLIALTWLGPCPEGMEVCHNDGDAANNHLENLRYDTPTANRKDRRKHLCEQATQMRNEHASGIPVCDLIRKYCYSEIHIRRILQGIRYAEAAGPIITRRHCHQISDSEVVHMREMRAAGMKLSALEKIFGVSNATASRIVRGETHAGINGPLTFRKSDNGTWRLKIIGTDLAERGRL